MNTMHKRAAYGRGAGAYARVGVESNVMSATPHQLIMMLFDGAQTNLRTAKLHLEKGQMAEKGAAISKVLDIVNNGLLAALDREQGGEVAENLASLYEYVNTLLLQANLQNDVARLEEAERLLESIGSAWREMGEQSLGA